MKTIVVFTMSEQRQHRAWISLYVEQNVPGLFSCQRLIEQKTWGLKQSSLRIPYHPKSTALDGTRTAETLELYFACSAEIAIFSQNGNSVLEILTLRCDAKRSYLSRQRSRPDTKILSSTRL